MTERDNYSIKVFPRNSEGIDSCWRWSQEKISKEGLVGELPDVIAKQKRDGDWNIYQKSRKSTTKVKSIWDETAVISEQGTVQLGQLGLSNYFDHPKPIALIKKAIQIATQSDDIVLDFFAGSGTTAHAVMEQNAEDGGNRRFICVQLPEPTDPESEAHKAGFKTIADITKERIRRAAAKLNEADQNAKGQDRGFRVLTLDKSNFKRWQKLGADATVEQISAQLDLHIEHVEPSATPEDLLFEILLKAGFRPTEKYSTVEIAGIPVFSVAEGSLLVCLAPAVTRELIDAVSEAEPMQFVCLDSAFGGNDQLKANAAQTFAARNQGRDKARQIIFRTV